MKGYVDHLAGFSLLLDWQARWRSLPQGVSITKDGMELGSWASRRFLLAAPRRQRYGDGLVLGVQSPELIWFSRLKFKRAALAIDREPARLFMITSRVAGDASADDVSDIPAFSLGLQIDSPDLATILPAFRRLEVRSVWVEDDRLQIASGPPVCSIPMEQLPEGAPVLSDLERQEGRTMDEMISQRLASTNRYQVPSGA